MPPDTLEFEEPIAVLLKEIDALAMLPQTPARQAEIDGLARRIEGRQAVRAWLMARGLLAASSAGSAGGGSVGTSISESDPMTLFPFGAANL